jgi:hypothetical protein
MWHYSQLHSSFTQSICHCCYMHYNLHSWQHAVIPLVFDIVVTALVLDIVVMEHHPQSDIYLLPFTTFLFLLAAQRALAGNICTPSWKTVVGKLVDNPGTVGLYDKI